MAADGIGDTIRVSLSEDPVEEIPVARTLLAHIARNAAAVPSPKRLITLSERDPWFTPMRIAVPLARHSSRNGSSRWRRRCSDASVAQAARLAGAGAELIRLTAQGIQHAAALEEIHSRLRSQGIMVNPL